MGGDFLRKFRVDFFSLLDKTNFTIKNKYVVKAHTTQRHHQ
jgi:hypothetical protein